MPTADPSGSLGQRISTCLPMIVALILLPGIAFASPPDPSWIAGMYNGGDGDDIVTLVYETTAANTTARLDIAPTVCLPEMWLREIVASPPVQDTATACYHAPKRLSWARLLKRVFDIDIEHCPNCGGSLKIIACRETCRRAAPSTRLRTGIEDPPVIVKILAHLGLPTRAPPRSPAQRFDLFQTI